MLFHSTRNKNNVVDSATAILGAIADDGGLYIPFDIPKFNIKDFLNYSYKELAFEIISTFFDDLDIDDLHEYVYKAYEGFDTENVVELKSVGDRHFIELFHGKTIAFKDVALSLLPYLMKLAVKKNNTNKKILIITATSGDTGKAALEAFTSINGINIIVLYPNLGVSHIQKYQMITQIGDNVEVVAIDGNFDDAQSSLKEILNDKDIKLFLEDNNIQLSSANSINIGRLIPQIVYYIYSYIRLVNENKIELGDTINICVPTGNFGNILAAYYAYRMGLPVNKFICASNDNNVLTEFFNTLVYDKSRVFKITTSPSMDILVSSNLERFLYYELSKDDLLNEKMVKLNEVGKFSILNHIDKVYADCAFENEVDDEILRIYNEYNYLIDTHTAVGSVVYNKYKLKSEDKNTATIIAATASPYKFPKSVLSAIGKCNKENEFEMLMDIEKITNIKIPDSISNLENREIRFNKVISKNEIKTVIKDLIKNK